MSEPTNLQKAIAAVTDEIMHTARVVSGEQSEPMGDVDRSDDTISDGKERIVTLRRIRNELENLESGVIL